MPLSADQDGLKAQLIATGEPWSETWHNILTLDPSYFKAYLALRKVPTDKQCLPRKTQELILLSMDASCTHLYEAGVRAHTAAALQAGASKEEIMEALELTSVLGVHAVTAGVPCLQEVMREMGKESKASSDSLDGERQALKDDFVQRRGYWSTSWPPVLQLSPGFFKAYTDYSGVPFEEGHRALEPKVKELIYCAIDCATTHLYLPGLKIHIRNAINYGATEEEVMEVFELAALMGAQTVKLGADVLVDEMTRARQ